MVQTLTIRSRVIVGILLLATFVATQRSLPTRRDTVVQRPHSSSTRPWRTIRVIVTGYVVSNDTGCTTFHDQTASGTRPMHGTAAVDPRVFRLGSTVFRIPHYGYAIARDTGSYIHGRHIDVVLSSCAKAWRWGVRHLDVSYAIRPQKT